MSKTDIEKLSTPRELARYFDVAETTIGVWRRTGVIPRGAWVRLSTKTYRYRLASVGLAIFERKLRAKRQRGRAKRTARRPAQEHCD